ncbi:hypothetical protein [Pantanalinema sp. GBBB05]|uniref:hypothetical protein n=1 Tax=Pantanalinema sp. GBBB05 TaxID=2604139 RepID=UPI001E0DD8E6|nr:hypothetical protein [Pantanalinema sp. GBBB05]
MSRESCISHRAKQMILVIRQDYYELMNRDATAAAIMGLFEYWANAAISSDPDNDAPNLGERSIREFQDALLGVSTDKQIRIRLQKIEAMGFIKIEGKQSGSKPKRYQFFISKVQHALNKLEQTHSVKQPNLVIRSNDQTGEFGQTTELTGSNNQMNSVKQPNGIGSNNQMNSVKQPNGIGSNNQMNSVKQPNLEASNQDVVNDSVSLEFKRNKEEEREELAAKTNLSHNASARAEIRMRTGNLHPELVQAGLGEIWHGPGWNDFDPEIVKACCRHLKKINFPHEYGNGLTYVNNCIYKAKWGELEQRRNEMHKFQAEQQHEQTPAIAEPEPEPEPLTGEELRAKLAELKQKISEPKESRNGSAH